MAYNASAGNIDYFLVVTWAFLVFPLEIRHNK